MKTLSFILVLFFSLGAMAHPCPEYIKHKAKALQAFEFMQRWPRSYVLGDCQIEIFTCSGWEKNSSNVPVAEILIIDNKGREAYVSLQFPEEENEFLKIKTLTQKRVLHYEKIDRFYEIEFGRTEAARLEITTEWNDPLKMKRLELGLYSTNHQLHAPDGNKSEWFICSDKNRH